MTETYSEAERRAAMDLIYANEDNRKILSFDDAVSEVRRRKTLNIVPASGRDCRAAPPVPGERESEFQRRVEKLAKEHGWMCYHTYDSQKSEPGYPDLHCVHPDRGLSIYVELKTVTGKASQAQVRWLLALQKCGETVYLWSPDDWDEIERVLTLEVLP